MENNREQRGEEIQIQVQKACILLSTCHRNSKLYNNTLEAVTMKDLQHSVLYPWQIDEYLLAPKLASDMIFYRGDKAYKEWPCAFPSCQVMLNDIGTKNRKRIYCDVHQEEMCRIADRNRWKRWKERQNAVVLP
jgi:hypothetical protein